MMASDLERRAILAEDKRIKAELAQSEPYLKNSPSDFESWEKALKKDASRFKKRTRYVDLYESSMN